MKKPVFKTYGRRLSRPLKNEKKETYDSLLSNLKAPLLEEDFFKIKKQLHLEIGFGGGEHLAKMAFSNPDIQFIGAEPFINGIASLLIQIKELELKNIWIWDENVHELFKLINKKNVFDRVYLLFADPWPKKRHYKRRFIQKENIQTIHELLKESAEWRIATDHSDYREWMLDYFSKEEDKFKQIRSNIYTRPNIEDWPLTRYEEKARRENRSISYKIFQKSE